MATRIHRIQCELRSFSDAWDIARHDVNVRDLERESPARKESTERYGVGHVAVRQACLRLRRPCRGPPTRRDERRQRPKYMTQGIAAAEIRTLKIPSKFPTRSVPRSTRFPLLISRKVARYARGKRERNRDGIRHGDIFRGTVTAERRANAIVKLTWFSRLT